MYFPAVNNLALIEARKDENVLLEFSQSVKRNVAAEVASYMLLDSTPPSVLQTSFHLRWAMEAIGQGFSLPLEDERIINAAIEIYRRWALVPAKQPPCWPHEEQFFLQRVIMHSSLIFIPRASSPNDLLRHLELCSQVLTLYINIARQLDKRLSLETWEVFLKVLIGVSEHLFHSSESEFGRKISTQLIKVLCEVLIRSRMQDPLLWETLKGFFVSWTHLISVVTQWNMTTLALTKKAVNILYGPTEGTDAVVLKTDDTVNIDIDDDSVLYLWHRMLTIIGSPNSFHDSRCYTLVFTGIEQIVKQFLKLGQVENPAQKSALDGNALLHVFGAPLFQAVKADRIGFEEGTSLALRVLSSIFCTLNQTLWLPIYLAQFYDCLQGVMHKEGAVLIAGVLNSSFVFSQGMEGANILVPAFLYAIRRIFAKKTTELAQFAPADQVRMSCLKILSLLVCVPYHFDMTDLKYKPRSTLEHIHFKTYAELTPFMSTIITEGMSSETHPANLIHLINLAGVYMFQYVAQDAKFTTVAITWMVNGIVQKLWTKEVIVRALSVLSAVASLYKILPKPDERARHIVSSLARSVLGLLDDQAHEIICLTFHTIADWLQADQWILSPESTEALNMLVEAVVSIFKTRDNSNAILDAAMRRRGIVPSKPGQTSAQEDIWEAAELMLNTLLNLLGYWPSVAGPERLSTITREEHALATLMQYVTPDALPQYIRFFITADARLLLTVIDQPFRAGDPCVTVIMRSKNGRYAWSLQSTTLPFLDRGAPSSVHRDVPASSAVEPIITQDQEMEESSFPDLFQFLKSNTSELRHSAKVLTITEKQAHKEVLHMSRNQFGLAVDISLPVPSAPNPHEVGMGKVPEARVLLSNLGFFNENGYHRLYPISMTDALMGALDNLDSCLERETFSIAVCMVSNAKGVVTNGGASLEFMQFVLSLGWIINPATHCGYMGNADLNGVEKSVYWANHRTEIMFHVSPMMPSGRQVLEDSVAVLWVEEQPNYDFATFFHNKALPQLQTAIVIQPLASGMYQVRVLRRQEKALPLGPIHDGMVLARSVLGQLVRETALTSARSYAMAHDSEVPYIVPSLKRQLALEEIGKRFASIDCTAAQFFGTLFSAAKELRARGAVATSNNTARGRGASNAAAQTPAVSGSTPQTTKVDSGTTRPVAATFMGTTRGAVQLPQDDTISPRVVTPTAAAIATVRGAMVSPVPAPASPSSTSLAPTSPTQWRAPDIWKGAEAGSSPSGSSALRDRVVETATPKSGSGREDPSKRHSRLYNPKDLVAVEDSTVQRSGSFSAAQPTPPHVGGPKLDIMGVRRGTGPIAKEPVKPPSPAGSNVAPSTTPTNPSPLGTAAGWKPAVTKTPVTKP